MEVQELNSFNKINIFSSLFASVGVTKVKELFWYSEYFAEVGRDENALYREGGKKFSAQAILIATYNLPSITFQL